MPPLDLPADDPEPGLTATAFYDPENWTFPGGCHVCELEIDPEPASSKIARIVAVDDVGTVINPMIVEGQIQGGLAQRSARRCSNTRVFDPDSGQLLTGSFMDYAMPRADTLPRLKSTTTAPSAPTIPWAPKAVPKSAAVGLPPAIVNAALDALSAYGVKHLEMPLTAEHVWRAMKDKEAGTEAL